MSTTNDKTGASGRRDLANAIRALAMDAVQQANSGHPGMPMGMADIAEVLWNDFLRHNPGNPGWANRDRFVLSNGHGSMLLYAVLHLTGYPLSMDDLRHFRQLGSPTAGHPERSPAHGIETTTGPLGQGLANAVGMALAEKVLAAHFNQPGFPVVDHHTYVFLGDGCLMEGISHEACSLAGTLKLGKLICFYDHNGISIDGHVDGWFADDTAARFRAYGWQVIPDVDGHDPQAIRAAVIAARQNTEAPTLICCRTIIGFGAPNLQGTEATHGSPLGAAEVAAARERLGWTSPPFVIPDAIRAGWDARGRGERQEAGWRALFGRYAAEHPELAREFERRMRGELPDGWAATAADALARAAADTAAKATRKASLEVLNVLGPALPELIGGSADLTGSNLTLHVASVPITAQSAAGNYIHYGVREFGMSAMLNGLNLHGGFIAYGGTFLVFSDYARNALRMAALMKVGSIFVLTHDSIGLGEDGPTHQPVEHVASLQLIPNMRVWRPCDTAETAVAWRDAVERRDGPSSLVLSRQNLPAQARSAGQLDAIRRGGYVLMDAANPDIILMASGSEVALAMAAAAQLAASGCRARVVSMPCAPLFAAQDAAWQEAVLPAAVTRRIAIEAGVTDLWYRFVGPAGRVIGMHGFGESAPAKALFEHFGLTADHIVRLARELGAVTAASGK
ncbi:transketolase [Gammaproteobacteria bacterium]|nr:MAG: transketolase [Gammaproteobacteria bacterium]CAG0940793.1 transketolase [Gammaproteobacteria bacterium]